MLRQIINFIFNKDGGAEGKAYEAGYLAGKHDGYEEGHQVGLQAGLRRGKVSNSWNIIGEFEDVDYERIVSNPHSARVDYAPGFDSIRGPSDERVLSDSCEPDVAVQSAESYGDAWTKDIKEKMA